MATSEFNYGVDNWYKFSLHQCQYPRSGMGARGVPPGRHYRCCCAAAEQVTLNMVMWPLYAILLTLIAPKRLKVTTSVVLKVLPHGHAKWA